MVTPACRYPSCWDKRGSGASAMETWPAATSEISAPSVTMTPWRAKLARTRASALASTLPNGALIRSSARDSAPAPPRRRDVKVGEERGDGATLLERGGPEAVSEIAHLRRIRRARCAVPQVRGEGGHARLAQLAVESYRDRQAGPGAEFAGHRLVYAATSDEQASRSLQPPARSLDASFQSRGSHRRIAILRY